MTTRKQMYDLTKKLEKFVGTGMSLYSANSRLIELKKLGYSLAYRLESVARKNGLDIYDVLTQETIYKLRRFTR